MDSSPDKNRSLRLLAATHGIQTGYFDISGTWRQATDESLATMLQALGAPLNSREDAPAAWQAHLSSPRRLIEPVIIAWEGEAAAMRVTLPQDIGEKPVSCHLRLESGDALTWEWHHTDAASAKPLRLGGGGYIVRTHLLPKGLALGYHQLALEIVGKVETSLVISAPLRAYSPEEESRGWGVFLPLYSLHTQRSWGAGDFTDLAELGIWLKHLGGDTVATLPLLAAFLGDNPEPSPYLPASRLAWNEFYLDVMSVPELEDCPEARSLLNSTSFNSEIDALRRQPLVDYQRQIALKRRILELLCQHLFSCGGGRLAELSRFARDNPTLADYARFRAVGEKQHAAWPNWPQALRNGAISESDYEEADRRYHLYVQWLADSQLALVSKRNEDGGIRIYLDLPLGVHPAGYDIWRERGSFISGMTTGAPPDSVFTRGQDWSFPPPHPQRIREQGYRYFIACLRHSMRHARVLRLDHVMGLHRLFCIPQGMAPDQGMYLRYRASELYAILALESQRHKVVIIGEDLGTVPPYVRPAMEQHGLRALYVLRYELAGDPTRDLPTPSTSAVASLNTHDMFPFAGFWQGREVSERLRLGIINQTTAEKERAELPIVKSTLTRFLREQGLLGESEDIPRLVAACLRYLASSPSLLVLINLEDLWQETAPQNIPSTIWEHPNWCRRTRYSFEEFREMETITSVLSIVNEIRRQAR